MYPAMEGHGSASDQVHWLASIQLSLGAADRYSCEMPRDMFSGRVLLIFTSLCWAAAAPAFPDSSQLVPTRTDTMTTAVVGAGGATGLECVKKLLSEGHTVKAVSTVMNRHACRPLALAPATVARYDHCQ